MQSSNSFNNNLLLFVAVGVILSVCICQAVFARGAIISWGEMVVDSSELDCNDFVAIDAGRYHSLALKQDGSVVGWGKNTGDDGDYAGQATPPVGNNYTAIAAGGWHSLALKQDGTIVGWGDNSYGQAIPPEGCDYVAIAAGRGHSLALKQDGSIVGWGNNVYGQAIPPDGNDYVAIAAGEEHCLALRRDGTIVGWGNNYSGEATPPAGNDFMAIGTGGSYSIALRQDCSIVAWGWDGYHQATPPAGNDYVAIFAGLHHACALKQDGSIVAWGSNEATPPAGIAYVAIAAGGWHSLALKQDGSIVGWGRNLEGQAIPPVGSDYVAIAAGQYQSLVLKQGGSIIGWGRNGEDNLETPPPAENEFVAIAGGYFYSIALKEDGTIVGWGDGLATPPAGNDYVAIAGGGFHSLALKEDGSVVGWGNNGYGQTTPSVGSDYVAIAAGWLHSLALKQDGSIVGWGRNLEGQATPPAGNDYVAIAAGGYHSLAIEIECFYISAATGDDNNNGLSLEAAFATIQKGIDEAEDGDTVLVYPGVYTEEIDFLGKAITVQSAEDAAVLEAEDYFAVLFYNGEGPDSVLKNFVIENSFVAVFIDGSSPTISNVTVADNMFGIAAYGEAQPDISNSIFWYNIYGDVFGCEVRYSCTTEPGEGNLDIDPLFVDPDSDDYHLLSERGRYWAEHDVWVLDEVTSPCIDGGDPAANYSGEPMPNGGRINMGAYGGTAYASMKEMRWSAGDINHDGWINMTDFVVLAEKWLTYEPPTSNLPPEVSIIEPQDGAQLYSAEIQIEADAWDVDGLVRIVEFFANGAEIGEDDDGSDGWKTIWAGYGDGTHSIGAKATDDGGAVATSLPIEIHIEGKGRFCFPVGTGVWIDGELVRFSEVVAGQRVAGFGGACAEGYSKQVERIEEHEGVFFECYDIVLENGGHISVVGSHLFLTESGRWSPVQDLRAGMKLRSMNGTVGIGSVTRRPLPYIGKVYNLKVKDGDRYLVGKDGIIVRDY